MGDLAAGLVMLAGLSSVCFWIGISIERRCSAATANVAGFVAVVAVVLYATVLHGRLVLARILPLSSVIVVGNVIPLGAAALSGILAGRRSIPRWRRTAVGIVLTALAWYTVLYDLLGRQAVLGPPRYDQGFCLQTNRASCSACCAASLLREHGIPATEKEMVELSLTREHGTPALGLYRGLKLKTRGTCWDVQVFRGSPEDLQRAQAWPVILLVRLVTPPGREWIRTARPSPRFVVEHAVVVYAITDGKAIVGDPAAGRRRWSLEMLERAWGGEGLRLVRHRRRQALRLKREDRPKALTRTRGPNGSEVPTTPASGPRDGRTFLRGSPPMIGGLWDMVGHDKEKLRDSDAFRPCSYPR